MHFNLRPFIAQKSFFFSVVATTLLLVGSQNGVAGLIVLDQTNGYEATIAPGLTVSQPDFTASGRQIRFQGGTFVLGTTDVADFSGATFNQIGGSVTLGNPVPGRAVQMVGVPFTLRDDATLELYDGELLFFNGRGSVTGTPPSGSVNPGAAFNFTLATPTAAAVPEPSSFVLLGLAAGPLVLQRRRRAHRNT